MSLDRISSGLSYNVNVKAIGNIYNFGLRVVKRNTINSTIFTLGTYSGVLYLPGFDYAEAFAALQPYYYETFEQITTFPTTKNYKPTRNGEGFWYRYYITGTVTIVGNIMKLPVEIKIGTSTSDAKIIGAYNSDGTYEFSGYYDSFQPKYLYAYWNGKLIKTVALPIPTPVTGK